MKRMGKLLCCLAMALTVLWNLPVKQVKAEGEEFAIEEFDMRVTQQGEDVAFHVEVTGNTYGLSSLETKWVDVNDQEYTVTTYLTALENTKYEGTSQVFLSENDIAGGMREGSYRLVSVRVNAINDADSITYVKGTDTNIAWDGFSIEISKDSIPELDFPVLNKLGFPTDKNITLSADLPVEMSIPNKDRYDSLSIQCLFIGDNNDIEAFEYNIDNGLMGIPEYLRFKSENYKFIGIRLIGSKTYGEGRDKYAVSFYGIEATKEAYCEKYGGLYEDGTIVEYHDIKKFYSEDYVLHINNYVNDKKAPVLKDFHWTSDPHVVLPGKVTFEVDFEEDLKTMIYLYSGNQQIAYVEGNDGKAKGVIPFRAHASLDPIEITGISLTDEAENEAFYSIENQDANFVLQPVEKLTFERYLKYDAFLRTGTEYINDLKNATEGMTFLIDTTTTSIIPKEVFETIQGKDITLIFEITEGEGDGEADTGVQYIFNGKDITNPKTIDVAVKTRARNSKTIEESAFAFGASQNMTKEDNLQLLQDLKQQSALAYYYNYLNQFDPEKEDFGKLLFAEVEKWEYLEIVFKPNGQLPGKARVRVTKDNHTANHLPDNDLKIYYQNADGSYELVGSNIDMEYDGRYEFTVDHNSTYLMTRMDLSPKEETPNPDDPQKPEDNTKPEEVVTPDTETPKEETKLPEKNTSSETDTSSHKGNIQAENTTKKPDASSKQKQVDTGDTSAMYWPYVMGLALLAGIVLVMKRRKEVK